MTAGRGLVQDGRMTTSTAAVIPSSAAERAILFAELAEWASNHPNLGLSQTFLHQKASDFINPKVVEKLLVLRERTVDRQVREIAPVVPAAEQIIADAPAPQAESTRAPRFYGPVDLLWTGIYTIETDSGHRTFQVYASPSDAEFAPGKTVLSYLSGPNNTDDYSACGFVEKDHVVVFRRFASNEHLLADIAQLVADPNAALTAKQCRRCGRVLTTPESVAAGYGPECVKKGDR